MKNIENLQIDSVMMWDDEEKDIQGMQLTWSANVGFGSYTIICEDGHWKIDSEDMEKTNNREFGKMLLTKFLDGIAEDY